MALRKRHLSIVLKKYIARRVTTLSALPGLARILIIVRSENIEAVI